jgi:RNA polymerase sigma-70 factor, ECF subfamily
MKERAVILTKAEVFEKLVRDNMKRAYFTALGFTGSHDIAMEISQEAFVRAFKNLSSYDESRNFFTWYYRILKNLWLNYERDRKRKKEVSFIELRKEKLSEDTEEKYDRKEAEEKLEAAIMQLDAEAREIIVLRELEGMDYREIAELLNIPQGTVMSRLFYARKKLAGIMRSII